jgi:hypothetical protein
MFDAQCSLSDAAMFNEGVDSRTDEGQDDRTQQAGPGWLGHHAPPASILCGDCPAAGSGVILLWELNRLYHIVKQRDQETGVKIKIKPSPRLIQAICTSYNERIGRW